MLPEIRTWSEWGRLFTDAALWAPAVREVCRQTQLPVTEIEAGYPGTNVAVFDYYDVLTDHGRTDWSAYPTQGGRDSHCKKRFLH